jgi:hypothetical protein
MREQEIVPYLPHDPRRFRQRPWSMRAATDVEREGDVILAMYAVESVVGRPQALGANSHAGTSFFGSGARESPFSCLFSNGSQCLTVLVTKFQEVRVIVFLVQPFLGFQRDYINKLPAVVAHAGERP